VVGLGKWALCATALCLIIAGRHGFTKSANGTAAAPPPLPTAMALSPPSSGAIALHADRRGHFMTSALINGRTATMLVDTGATTCAFREEEAESLGLRVGPNDFTREVGTANGTIRVAPIRIRLLQIGPVAVRDVEAVVIPRGRLGANLLGMSFLSRLREFNVAGARITLRG
jgi:aspartyl protease family protein